MTSQLDTDNTVPLPGDHVFISNIDIANDGYRSKRTENVIMLGNIHKLRLYRTYIVYCIYYIYFLYLLQLRPLQDACRI